MTLTPEQIAALRQRIDSLSPDEKSLLRELVAEKQQRTASMKLPKPKKPDPEPEFLRSFNGDLLRRRKR